MLAALGNHPAMVLRLLRAGADMTLRSSGRTALQYAKEKGHTECVEAFRTYLGEVAGRREAATAEADGARAGDAPAGEAEAGASAAASSSSGEGGAETAPGSEAVPKEVVLAARRGEEAAVLAWLDGGGRVDMRFEYTFGDDGSCMSGTTLLMIAMAYGHAGLAEALLRRGADISLQKSNGGTALSLAALNGHEKLAG